MKLTPLEPEDLELLYDIENDPSLWSIGSANVPYSRYALRDYIANQQCDIFADKQVRLVVRVEEEKASQSSATDGGPLRRQMKSVGLVDLFNFSPDHLRAELGIAILKSEQGKGYGRRAVRRLLDYAYHTLHINMVYAIVPEDNSACLATLRSEGFGYEHRLIQWLQRADGWHDAIVLQKLLRRAT